MTTTGQRPRETEAPERHNGLVAAQRRFAERAAAGRRRGRRNWLLAAAAFAVVVLLAWVALAAPFFAVAKVEISGADAAHKQRVRTIADAAALGTPLLRVDTKAIEKSIEADPQFADATVRRDFPRGLRIDVVQRVPVLAVQDSKGQLQVIDIDGVAFGTVSSAPKGVPTVRGNAGAVQADGVRGALALLAAFTPPVRAKVRDIRLSAADSLSFRIGATAVTWGDGERPELKARVVEILLAKKPKGIDVSAPDTPVTT